MWPWFWFLTPNTYFPWNGNINFPLSGSVTQELTQSWFDQNIRRDGAGEPVQEQRIFELASYGKQLGIITDILLDLAGTQNALKSAEGQKALRQLQQIHEKVEQIKQIYGKPGKAKDQ